MVVNQSRRLALRTHPVLSGLGSIAFGAGKWVAGIGYNVAGYTHSIGFLYASDDLAVWSQVATNIPSVSSVVFGNGKFLASTWAGTFVESSNGMNWQHSAPEPTPFSLADMKYLDGRFVGVGGKRLSFSIDGTTWTNNVTITNTENEAYFESITFGNGRYVAGGQHRSVWTSLDGLNWTNPAPDLIDPAYSAVKVAYGNGVFVGVSGDQADVLASPDGLNWTAQELITNTSSSVSFSDVTFGNGRFVAVAGSLAATSTDGTNWTSAPTAGWLYSVAAGNGKFVGVGYLTNAFSTNGVDWTYQASSSAEPLVDVAFGGGFFVAIGTGGYVGLPREYPIWVSADGTHWSRRSSWTSRPTSAVAFGDGSFVVVGTGAILQSDPLVNLELAVQPAPHLLLWGPANRSYLIEFADTLNSPSNWLVLTNVFAGQCPISISDTNGLRRFYRAALLPH